MKYVKLVVKPNTWFKEGTEAYNYNCDWNDKYRITLDEWKKDWEPYGIVCVRGIRVCKPISKWTTIGEEYFDGETCGINEFDITIVDEKV